MQNWRTVKLKEVCREITVGHVGSMVNEYVDKGIPFLRSQNILSFNLNLDSIKYITPNFHKKLKKSALFPGDVAVVRTGYPGTACVIPKTLPVSNCADLVIIRPSNELNAYYLTCIFNSTWGQGTVAGNLVGVAQQHFNVSAAKEMIINLPSLPTQKKIAGILSAYDDLIENNTRRIKILEEMAQTLYHEWFVKFRFPGHEHTKMVDSELGLIPEGWEIINIGKIAKVKGGKRLPKGKTLLGRKTAHPYIRVKDMSDSGLDTSDIKYLDEETHQSIKRYIISSEDIYISIAGTIGRVGIIPKSLSYSNLTENAAKICEIREIDYRLLLGYLRTEAGQTQIASKVVGTSQPKLALFRIEEILLALPPISIQHKIASFFANTYAQIDNLKAKNQNLGQTRDLLLPKLISGEIDVEDLEITTEDIAA
ncbi:MAG: restriction endonuclease subunit S [Nostoc sp. DedQUE08]|uniref:restriction endonuclease subunit S n=1 Tax=Nostoc sp. DedQUE08 TaxID=3075393 RepID=UPI002AD30226|nr:restriction endonuclease subunit S [Nostoc sp. DedQUE08]MDZ8065935.1 restriction endonuclease subunit S [Nostoc sp. DedQUE08]